MTESRSEGTAFRTLLVVFVVLLEGCGGSDRSADVVVSDSAGVRIVESVRPAWTDTDAWHVSDTPVVRIGTVAGSEQAELFQVKDVDRLGDGRLVVTNQGMHELRVYSATGEFMHAVGREGRGPGEFMYPNRTWIGPDDSLFVRAFQRLAVFDDTGSFVRATGLPGWSPQDRFRDGTYLFVVIPPGLDRMEPGYFHPVNALVKAGADGSAGDTLARVSGNELYRFESSAGGVASFFAPFGSPRLAAAYGDSVITAAGIDFEVRLLDETGEFVRILRRSREREPVTGSDVADLEQELLDAAPDRTHPDRRRLVAEWVYPEFKPALDRLIVDSDGNIWARAYNVDRSDVGEWSVFDPSGRWLGDVETPPRLEVMQVDGGHVVGVWVDELDVEHVHVYSLAKP